MTVRETNKVTRLRRHFVQVYHYQQVVSHGSLDIVFPCPSR